MKKNYLFIVGLLLIGYVMNSWATVAPSSKYVIPTKHINYVELVTPEIESFFEIPIQPFSLENIEVISLSILVNDGDFRSKSSGVWSSFSSWEVLDLGVWRDADSSDGYPGELTGTNSVTIQAGHTITIVTNLITQTMGAVTVNGILSLNPSPAPNEIILNTSALDINGLGVVGSAKLNFASNKIKLTLPATSALVIQMSGTKCLACHSIR